VVPVISTQKWAIFPMRMGLAGDHNHGL
jgi:hypothetical protein